jgi:hypothetical protein
MGVSSRGALRQPDAAQATRRGQAVLVFAESILSTPNAEIAYTFSQARD